MHRHVLLSIDGPRQLLYRRFLSASAASSLVPLTKDTHPHLKRSLHFKQLSSCDLAHFKSILPSECVIEDPDVLAVHNEDWSKRYRGQSTLLLKPKSADQVSAILAYCHRNRLAVVPQGGNTGLVGGSVPVFDEIILSVSQLDPAFHFDAQSGVVSCSAGWTLQSLDEKLRSEYGYTVPLDLGAKGSCQIGGNLATNAGGLRLLKYGSLRGSVLGLQATLADGRAFDLSCTLRKDNTGLDLKQLFIGSEGTLGVITSLNLLACQAPIRTSVLLLSVPSYSSLVSLLSLARSQLCELLSAFEFWDEECVRLVYQSLPGLQTEFGHLEGPFRVLIETSHYSEEGDGAAQRLEAFMLRGMERGWLTDGVVSTSERQSASIWKFRESLPEACARVGRIYKYDISLPTPILYDLVPLLRERLALHLPSAHVVGYGHAGDGNLHLNIMLPLARPGSGLSVPAVPANERGNEALILGRLLEPFIYEWIASHRGSVSAEHGLGLMKRSALSYSKSPLAIQWMKDLKSLFDPHGILNPYKMLP